MKKYSENCKLKNHQKTWKSKKTELPENNVCHLVYSCVNVQYAQRFDISIQLGFESAINIWPSIA